MSKSLGMKDAGNPLRRQQDESQDELQHQKEKGGLNIYQSEPRSQQERGKASDNKADHEIRRSSGGVGMMTLQTASPRRQHTISCVVRGFFVVNRALATFSRLFFDSASAGAAFRVEARGNQAQSTVLRLSGPEHCLPPIRPRALSCR